MDESGSRLNDSFYSDHGGHAQSESESAGGSLMRLLRAPQRDAARMLFRDFCTHRGNGPIRRGGPRKENRGRINIFLRGYDLLPSNSAVSVTDLGGAHCLPWRFQERGADSPAQLPGGGGGGSGVAA